MGLLKNKCAVRLLFLYLTPQHSEAGKSLSHIKMYCPPVGLLALVSTLATHVHPFSLLRPDGEMDYDGTLTVQEPKRSIYFTPNNHLIAATSRRVIRTCTLLSLLL